MWENSKPEWWVKQPVTVLCYTETMEGWQLFPTRCQHDQSASKDDELGWPQHRSGAVTRPGQKMMKI